MTRFLIRYGEIALKSDWVRRKFQDRLVANIQDYFLHRGIQCMMRTEYGRIFLDTDEIPEASGILGRIFGITSFSPVETTTSGLEDIAQLAIEKFKPQLKPGTSFAVRARRSGNHKYSSPELASYVGGEIQSSLEGLDVDLDEPDVQVFIEVRENRAYVFGGRDLGPGGMPLGTQGVVVAAITSEEGIAGAWLMMKRGCKVHAAHFNHPEIIQPLKSWDIRLKSYALDDGTELDSIMENSSAQGFVTTWDERDTCNLRTNVPVFHPTIGLTKEELDDLLKRIGR
ncbi:MAG: THUMP domain-containing protein [Thermoplasmata archaeon]